MRTLRVLATAALTAGLIAVAAPAGAGNNAASVMSLSPTSGPPGTTTTIASVDPCYTAGGEVQAKVVVSVEGTQVYESAPSTNGAWSTTYTVPQSAQVGDELAVTAQCWYLEGLVVDTVVQTEAALAPTWFTSNSYATQIFTVTAPPTTTTIRPPWMKVVPTEMVPGDTMTIQGGGFAPGTEVQVWLESNPILLGTVIADEVGNVTLPAVADASWPTGPHTVRLLGSSVGGSVINMTVGITVGQVTGQVPTTAPTQGTLPATGSNDGLLAVGGVVLATSGLALVLWARRREDLLDG